MESLVSPDLNKIEILTTLFLETRKKKVLLELNGASTGVIGTASENQT